MRTGILQLFTMLAVCGVAAGSHAASQRTPSLLWVENLEAAKKLAAETNRLVIVHFTAPWCGPCQKQERTMFSQPGFGKELDVQFVGVKINTDQYPAVAAQFGIERIPTDCVIAPDGQLVARVESPQTTSEFVETMTRIAASRQGPAPSSRAAPTIAAASHATQGNQAVAAQYAVERTSAPGDRYAAYFAQRSVQGQSTQGATTMAPGDAAPVEATRERPMCSMEYAYAESMKANGDPARGAAAAASPAVNPRPTEAAPTIPPGNAPLGFDGFCLVSMVERQVWTRGDVRYGVQHRGRTYLFAGPEEQKKFWENPDGFTPVLSGIDPVLQMDEGKSVAGSRHYAGFYGNRIYMFSSEATYQTFGANPTRYAAEITQAMR